MPLLSEINAPAIENRVLRAARFRFGRAHRYQADFEHGQWWLTMLDSGAQYSVVTCQTAEGVDYLDFEEVSAGDHDR